jgi:hypothetical protein
MRSLEMYKTLVASSTTGLTVDQIQKIAQQCFDNEAAGKNSSVWHSMNEALHGSTKNCPCVPCRKAGE